MSYFKHLYFYAFCEFIKLVDGKSYVVDVKHPENLDKVKVGDRIEIIYTESVALQVKAASKKKDAKKK